MSTEQKSPAFMLGYYACKALANPVTACPYIGATKRQEFWLGWDRAEHERSLEQADFDAYLGIRNLPEIPRSPK